MKIKITHPILEKDLQAGLIYDLPEADARAIIEQDFGFVFEGEDVSVAIPTDIYPVSIETEKPKTRRKKS